MYVKELGYGIMRSRWLSKAVFQSSTILNSKNIVTIHHVLETPSKMKYYQPLSLFQLLSLPTQSHSVSYGRDTEFKQLVDLCCCSKTCYWCFLALLDILIARLYWIILFVFWRDELILLFPIIAFFEGVCIFLFPEQLSLKVRSPSQSWTAISQVFQIERSC